MTTAVERVLSLFETLSNAEKVDVVTELARRAGHLEYPPLDDEALSQIADELFQELDREEARKHA